MTILYEKDNYRIESLNHNVLRELRTPLIQKVYNNYSSFDTSGLNELTEKQSLLNQNKAQLFSLNLGLFYKDQFIGWSDGLQSADNRYYMKNSGIIQEHRGRGLYSRLLESVISETKKEGFLELYSSHNTDNNRIIVAKLKKDFFISGFEVLPKYGLTVQLTYCHNDKLKKMYEFRVGRVLSADIEDRFDSSFR